MEEILGTTLVVLLVLGPLVWRNWMDRRGAAALSVHARIRASVCRLFRGEPLLSIHVRPALPWRTGRVILSTPAGWEWVIEAAWNTLIAEVPPGYELVIKPAATRRSRTAPMTPAVRHA